MNSINCWQMSGSRGNGQGVFYRGIDGRTSLAELQERLAKLASVGDIPAEVLMSLPSPEEIRGRAGEAKYQAAALPATNQK